MNKLRRWRWFALAAGVFVFGAYLRNLWWRQSNCTSYLDAVVTATQHVITKLRCDAACYFLHAAPRVPGQRGRTRKYDDRSGT